MKPLTKQQKAKLEIERKTTEAARWLQSRRKYFGGGRPKAQRPCLRCGEVMGARELRAHKCEVKVHA